MQYKFENKIVLKVLEKLVIVTTNLLIYYLMFKLNYTEPLLITKLMFIDIIFKIFKKIGCTYKDLIKSRRKTKSG